MFPSFSSTYTLTDQHSLSVDTTIVVSTKCPDISEEVMVVLST